MLCVIDHIRYASDLEPIGINISSDYCDSSIDGCKDYQFNLELHTLVDTNVLSYIINSN